MPRDRDSIIFWQVKQECLVHTVGRGPPRVRNQSVASFSLHIMWSFRRARSPVKVLPNGQSVKLTDVGRAIIMCEIATKWELQIFQLKRVQLRRKQRNVYRHTYLQILHHPIKAFNAFRRYWPQTHHGHEEKHRKKMIKKTKLCLPANHKIWFTNVNRLSSIIQHGHLRQSQHIEWTYPDDHDQETLWKRSCTIPGCTSWGINHHPANDPRWRNNGNRSAVVLKRIARDSDTFPSMRFPVSMPLTSESVCTSRATRSSMIPRNTPTWLPTHTPSNDLEDSMERLTTNM